jgi:hypothetical protein
MQARNETIAVGQDETQIGPVQPTTRGRTPRFKLIKLEERIAPGGLIGGTNSMRCAPTGGHTAPTTPQGGC